jgi:hypothetical protein
MHAFILFVLIYLFRGKGKFCLNAFPDEYIVTTIIGFHSEQFISGVLCPRIDILLDL